MLLLLPEGMIDMRKADLEYIRILNNVIDGRLLRIAELKSKAYPGAIAYDDSGASKPSPSNKLEEIFCQIDEEERRINKLIDKRYALKCQAIKEIQQAIDPDDMVMRHILYLRYLSRKPDGASFEWSDVAKHIGTYHNIRLPRIYQLHHDAVLILSHHKM